jgi:uncharacterized membrane protein
MIKQGKNTANSTNRVIRQALLISAVSFILLLALCVGVWIGLRTIGLDTDLLVLIQSVATTLAVAQVIGGSVVALRQLQESTDSRNLAIYNDIFEKLMSEQDIEARRWIYQNLPDLPEEGLRGITEDGQAHIKRALNSLDHLGFLLHQDWITDDAEDAIIRWVSPFVVKTWQKIGPYVDHEAQRRNEPDYYEFVRELAQRCIQWRQHHLPGHESRWLKDAL